MTDWNPTLPGLLGVEWLPVITADDILSSDAACFAQRLTSTAAETISELRLFMPTVTTPGRYILEVYEAGDEVGGSVSTTTYRPNQDSLVFNVEDEVGGTVNIYTSVDEAVLDLTDYIRTTTPATGFGHLWTFKLASAGWPASRRVTQMRWKAVGRQISGQHEWEWAIRRQTSGFLRLLSTAYNQAAGQFEATAFMSDINPFTGQPWLRSEIQSLDSTVDPTRLSLRHGWSNPVDTTSEGRLYQSWLEIDWIAENRVAWGTADVDGSSAYVVFPMFQPDGTVNYSKLAATDYTYTLRRIPGVGNPDDPQAGPLGQSVGSVGWRYHDAQNAGLPVGTEGDSFAPDLDATGVIADLGDVLTRGRSLVLRESAPAASDDGIYGQLLPTFPDSSGTVRQQVTTGAAQTYDAVAFVAGIVDLDDLPGDLLVRVKRFSDDVQFGGDATLTAADFVALDASAQGWAQVLIEFSSAPVLAAATQYYVEFEAAEAVGTGWQIAYGGFPIVPHNFGVASFAGTTDALRPHFSGSYLGQADAWVMLADLPDDTFTGVALNQQDLAGDGSNCSIDELDYVTVSWTASVHANFDHYEIQRSIDGEVTWETIANIFTVGTVSFDDYEGPRDTEACYRQRVWAYSPAIPGPWSTTACVTPASYGCGVLFTSNEDPSLNVGYVDLTNRVYEFLDAPRAVLLPIFDRDRQIAAQPTERLGDRWAMQLVISADPDPPSPGRRLFDDIEEIARADLPHVTVLDEDGNRWIALVQVSRGTRDVPGTFYVSDVAVTEIATSPTPVVG